MNWMRLINNPDLICSDQSVILKGVIYSKQSASFTSFLWPTRIVTLLFHWSFNYYIIIIISCCVTNCRYKLSIVRIFLKYLRAFFKPTKLKSNQLKTLSLIFHCRYVRWFDDNEGKGHLPKQMSREPHKLFLAPSPWKSGHSFVFPLPLLVHHGST